VVSEGNLKVQVSHLRRALGTDCSAIRTEFGRGYRFTGVLCSTTAANACHPHIWTKLPSARSQFPFPPRAFFPFLQGMHGIPRSDLRDSQGLNI
jgi:DNA-binding winged helix-turn-helix (wHTH) protein